VPRFKHGWDFTRFPLWRKRTRRQRAIKKIDYTDRQDFWSILQQPSTNVVETNCFICFQMMKLVPFKFYAKVVTCSELMRGVRQHRWSYALKLLCQFSSSRNKCCLSRKCWLRCWGIESSSLWYHTISLKLPLAGSSIVHPSFLRFQW